MRGLKVLVKLSTTFKPLNHQRILAVFVCNSKIFAIPFPVVLSYAFACDAKSFSTPFFVVFYFPSCRCFWTDLGKLFANNFWFITQSTPDQDRTVFIGHTKIHLPQNCFISCYSRRLWYMKSHAFCLFTVGSIHSI